VTGDWRKLRNEELRNLYASPNIVRVIKAMRMRWEVHTARVLKMRNVYKILVKELKGIHRSEDLGMGGNIILEWILGWEGVDWIHLAQDSDQWRAHVKSVDKVLHS